MLANTKSVLKVFLTEDKRMCKNYHGVNKVISISRYMLIFSFVAVVICLLVSYPYAELFNMPTQISAHILTILFAGSLKVAVVALMAANKEGKNIARRISENGEACCTH